MVLKTIILLATALSVTSSQQMTCTYSFSPATDNYRYQCDLSVNNPDGLDDAVSIGEAHSGPSYIDDFGNLVSTYSDLSVQIVEVHGITKNIPSAICSQFPNIAKLNFNNSGIQILSATKCSKITELRLSYNLIEDSNIDLCQNQPFLRIIYLNNNKLKSLSDITLKSCKNLVKFNVDNNQISSISSTIFTNTPIVQSISIGGNPIPAIPNGIFTGLTAVKQLIMHDLLISDLPLNVFSTNIALIFLDVRGNKLTIINSKWFSDATLEGIRDFILDDNEVNAVDPQFFQLATSLYSFSLFNNKCYNGAKITDFLTNRASYMPGFQTCIDNFAAL